MNFDTAVRLEFGNIGYLLTLCAGCSRQVGVDGEPAELLIEVIVEAGRVGIGIIESTQCYIDPIRSGFVTKTQTAATTWAEPAPSPVARIVP